MNGETWPCPLCEDGYGSRADVIEHLREDHGEAPEEFELRPYRP